MSSVRIILLVTLLFFCSGIGNTVYSQKKEPTSKDVKKKEKKKSKHANPAKAAKKYEKSKRKYVLSNQTKPVQKRMKKQYKIDNKRRKIKKRRYYIKHQTCAIIQKFDFFYAYDLRKTPYVCDVFETKANYFLNTEF